MAKLYLRYEQSLLKEVTLTNAPCTIGRLPDNTIQIDNLAVSGHHAKIHWDQDIFKYIIEDNNSLNGTYVNGTRVVRQVLNDGDTILVGKHTLGFEHRDGRPTVGFPAAQSAPPVPKLEQTVMLDTKRMKEMIAPAPAAASPAQPAAATKQYSMSPVDKTGVLTVLEGKTDQPRYLLTSKMSVIGKSEMASIKLKGWLAPQMAALISKRETDYFIAASEKKIKVKVNGAEISGQKALADGDTIEVAGVKMTFAFQG